MKRTLAGLMLMLTVGLAQEYRGTILGRITDPSGAAIAGASVEVRSVQTNAVFRASSNEAGNYQVPFLMPGEYTVRAEHTGFRKIERTGIRVLTNQAATVDIALEIGAITRPQYRELQEFGAGCQRR